MTVVQVHSQVIMHISPVHSDAVAVQIPQIDQILGYLVVVIMGTFKSSTCHVTVI